MAWIKRNLLFLIGCIISMVLLGVAGFYLFTRTQLNNELKEKINLAYADAESVINQQPGPGSGSVDNAKTAKDQTAQMQKLLARQKSFFHPIAPIPASADGTNTISDHEFASALRDTINSLQRAAAGSGVQLPPRYDFSFSAIKSRIQFTDSANSLPRLAQQLGEIEAIAEMVFRARVNSLDGIRRVRVSPDDKDAPDYLEHPPLTNDLAVIEPYELVFHSFSGELAGVLAGFASSTNGFRIKTVAVESSGAPMSASPDAGAAPVYTPPPAAAPVRNQMGEDEGQARPQAVAAPVYAPAVAAPARGGLATVINEHPLKVTLMLELVKLKPAAK